MAKHWIVVLAAVLVLTCATTSFAQINVKAQLAYGGLDYRSTIESKSANISEWSVLLHGTYTHDDLLFNALYNSGNRLSMSVGENEPNEPNNHSRSTLQFGGNYLLLQDTGLKVYGGLGYGLTWINVKHPQLRDGDRFSLAGKGFAGQAVVKFDLGDKFGADAFISASPWFQWEYTQGTTSEKSIGGSAYHYQLGFEYELTPEYSVRLGLHGGSNGVNAFEYDEQELDKTSSGYTGVTVGMSWNF